MVSVKLVGYTRPTGEFLQKGIEDVQDLVAFCARVSNPSNQYNTQTTHKLLQYLIKHKHWSPLELASATLEVETTRDIARQILRHRSFSFNEFSQRYADPAVFDEQFVLRDARLQDDKNRQNSVELTDYLPGHIELRAAWNTKQQRVIDAAKEAYDWATEHGIAKEQARVVLPEGNTKSRLYVNGTIRSWLHYCELRMGPETQKEHREVASGCASEIIKIFPDLFNFT